MKKKNFNKKAILLLLSFLPLIIYLTLVFNNKIWLDEGYTICMEHQKFSDIWNITANDVHPPLYYWGLYIWCSIFGFGITTMKIFSIIPILLLLILSSVTIKKEFGIKTAIIFNFLCSLCPFMMEYSIQIRMYSWAFFLCTASGLYAYKVFVDNKLKNWIVFFIYSISAIYTHFYSLLTVFMIFLLLLILIIWKKRELIKPMIVTSIGMTIVFIPWLIQLIKQVLRVSDNYWIEPLTIKEFLYIPINLLKISGGNNLISKITGLIYVLFIIFTFIICIKNKHKNTKDIFSITLLISFLGVLFISTLTSIILKPILYYRYLLIPFGLLLLFISIELGKLRDNTIISLFIVFTFIIMIPNYIYSFKKLYMTDYQEMIKTINETTTVNDYLLFTDYTTVGNVLPNIKDTNTLYLRNGKIQPYDSLTNKIDSILDINEKTNFIYYIIMDNQNIPKIITNNYSLNKINTFNNGTENISFYILSAYEK